MVFSFFGQLEKRTFSRRENFSLQALLGNSILPIGALLIGPASKGDGVSDHMNKEVGEKLL